MRALLALVALSASVPSLASEIRIVTVPPGADVWMGEVKVGVTGDDGLRLVGISSGPITYVIRKAGYVDEQRTINVDSLDQPITLVVTLAEEIVTDIARPELGQTKPPAGPQAKQEATPLATASAKKRSKTPLVLGMVGGAAAAGVGAVLLTKTDPLEVDDDGDGFSERQGDCNDTDRAVSPHGAVTFNFRPGVSGTVSCRQPGGTTEIRGTNLSCAAVSISNVQYSRTALAGRCILGTYSPTLNVSIPTLAPGARDQVVASRVSGSAVGC